MPLHLEQLYKSFISDVIIVFIFIGIQKIKGPTIYVISLMICNDIFTPLILPKIEDFSVLPFSIKKQNSWVINTIFILYCIYKEHLCLEYNCIFSF